MKSQSTYSLLVRSQEQGRSIFEGAVYATVVLSTVISILQFTMQSVTVPALTGTTSATNVAAHADASTISVRG